MTSFLCFEIYYKYIFYKIYVKSIHMFFDNIASNNLQRKLQHPYV